MTPFLAIETLLEVLHRRAELTRAEVEAGETSARLKAHRDVWDAIDLLEKAKKEVIKNVTIEKEVEDLGHDGESP